MGGKIFKEWPSGIMLIVVCLWQIVSAQVENDGYHLIRTPLPKLHLSTPEAFLGNYTSAAFFKEYTTKGSNLVFELYTFTRNRSGHDWVTVTTKPRQNPNVFRLREMRQIGKNFVVFMLQENEWKDFRWIRLIAANTSNNKLVNLQHDLFTHNPIIVPAGEDEFDLFVDNDPYICHGINRCRMRYNLQDYSKSYLKPFDLELDWPTVSMDRLDNGDLVATGFQGRTFKFILIDGQTYERHVLLEQGNHDYTSMKYISKGLAICWTGRGYEKNEATCQQYSRDRKLIMQKSVEFKEVLTIYHIEPISDEGGIFLIAKKPQCSRVENDCWDDFRAKTMYEIDPVSHPEQPITFSCTGNTNQLNVFKAKANDNKDIEINIGCRQNNGYYFNHQTYST